MACTVFANGRGVVHKGTSGMNIVFPDVCKTPAPPAGPFPFPIRTSESPPTPLKVRPTSRPTGTCRWSRAQSTDEHGDEPGSAGGIISGVTRVNASS